MYSYVYVSPAVAYIVQVFSYPSYICVLSNSHESACCTLIHTHSPTHSHTHTHTHTHAHTLSHTHSHILIVSIIKSFEAITANLTRQMNFTSLTSHAEDLILHAERVSIKLLSSHFNPPLSPSKALFCVLAALAIALHLS